MSRIKKRGLDYFPMNTDFLQNRLVRRIMKREGDASLAVLLQTYCCIYSGEGYYVEADPLFYDDLADCLYQQEAADVERIIDLAVEYGLFDPALYREHRILTSADIQRQFLFITKRRNSAPIESRYNLLPIDIPATEQNQTGTDTKTVTAGGENATENNDDVTFQAENDEKVPASTQSIEKQKKENPLLYSSPKNGGTADEGAKRAARKEWSDTDISALKPPQDGMNRNLDGLIFNLRQFRIPPAEQYAIICKSNFGVIGHPMWKGFATLRESHGKIRLPGHYLLSLCK